VTPRIRSVFAPGRETTLARVSGNGLRTLDVLSGDHVVLVRRDRAEHGDLAAVLDEQGRAGLWKVYPEAAAAGGERLRLSLGRPGATRWSTAGMRVHGIVVAVLRGARGTPQDA
jgi:hypothetical protein